jgi:hypothetical protein
MTDFEFLLSLFGLLYALIVAELSLKFADAIDLGTGIVSAFVKAVIGAIVLLFVIRLLTGGLWGGGWRGGWRRNVLRQLPEQLGMAVAKPLQSRFGDGVTDLPLELGGEQAASHPDLAVNPPDGQIQPLLPKREMPSANVVVDAVDQRSIKVEKATDPLIM